jgi:hypothetical protein
LSDDELVEQTAVTGIGAPGVPNSESSVNRDDTPTVLEEADRRQMVSALRHVLRQLGDKKTHRHA